MKRSPTPSVFTRKPAETIGALGEVGLIREIRRWLGPASPPPPGGIGDDCAVLPRSRGRAGLVTVDPVIYGKHFDGSVPPAAVGAKLLKRNLSDIAAMGGRPVAAVVALAVDPQVSRRWLASFYRGLAECALKYEVPVVGGDVAQADGVFVASLTLLGEAAGRRVLTRSGARPGDWIYVTGELGGSVGGGHHFRFAPRLAEGAWLAAQSPVRALIDLSDGLAKDLPAITPEGCAPGLFGSSIPVRRGASLASALGEGEDYELLFALAGSSDAAAFERGWKRRFPRVRLTRIGRFLRPKEVPGDALRLGSGGYEHLRG